MLGLHYQQNALQQQQNKIDLPQQGVPIFDGDPMEFNTFVRAFENIIESKTSNNSQKLYYLEQFTSGDAKELV